MINECEVCGEVFCEHMCCDCSNDSHGCPDCRRRRELEADAEREAAWQRNVMGPLLGFDEENDNG